MSGSWVEVGMSHLPSEILQKILLKSQTLISVSAPNLHSTRGVNINTILHDNRERWMLLQHSSVEILQA